MTNLFLSGFIFINTYNWLNNKEISISIMTIWSLFISILINSICSFVHTFVFKQIVFDDSTKILIYSMVGFISSIIVTWIRNTKYVRLLLYGVNNKSVNDDIFDDIIDYDKRTGMMVYLKTSPIVYIGRFLYREEKGADSYIALTDYVSLSTIDGDEIFNQEESDILSTVIINLKDIERIQLTYENDSDVWKKICIDNEDIHEETDE